MIDRNVAVLIDDATGSSGEATAVAFAGRPHTRLFGRHTAGISTVNDGYRMPDGANVVLTVGRYVDMKGRIYERGIDPDVLIEPRKEKTPENWIEEILDPMKDLDIQAAMNWLASQESCRSKPLGA